MKDVIDHFSGKDIIITFFGAFLVSAGFIFKGNLLFISQKLSIYHLFFIVMATIFVLSLEIYFLGYSRVRKKSKRPFDQFLLKRVACIYSVSIIVSTILVFIYNIDKIVADGNQMSILKIIISVSFPSSIGAAMTDLFKKF